MSDLAEFLLARIAEDEECASRVSVQQVGGEPSDPVLRWRGIRPRVLAECEAKRRIVAEHEMMPARPSSLGALVVGQGAERREVRPYYVDGCCACCTAFGEYGGPANAETGELDYCPTLRALATIYADHEDYRDEWRPEQAG